MATPERRSFALYPDARPGLTTEVWLVDEGDAWRIWCMDCGTRIGTVSSDNQSGAMRLTRDHQRALHLD